MGVPVSYDDIYKYLLTHDVKEQSTDNYKYICERIFVCFALNNQISLKRLRQPGFYSAWIKDLADKDKSTLNAYLHKFKKAENNNENQLLLQFRKERKTALDTEDKDLNRNFTSFRRKACN